MIKAGDVISTNKNTSYKKTTMYYLVVFSDNGSKYLNAIRIHFGNGNCTGNSIMLSVNNQIAWCNVFTGFESIHRDTIDSVISHVPQNIYDNIISSAFSVMKGSYSRNSDGNFIINESKSTINIIGESIKIGEIGERSSQLDEILEVVKGIKSLLEGRTIKKESFDSYIDVVEFDEEKSSTIYQNTDAETSNIVPVHESINMMSTSPICPVEKASESQEHDTELVEDPFSKPHRLREIYNTFTTNNKRVEGIFDLFGENGRIPLTVVYSNLVLSKDCRKCKNSLTVTREEFFILVNESTDNISRYTFTKQDGTTIILSKEYARQCSVKAKHLYYGTSPKSNYRKLTEKDIEEIRQKSKSASRKELAKEYEISVSRISNLTSDISHSRKPKSYKVNDTINRILDNNSRTENKYNEEVKNACHYITSRTELISLIASGVVIKEYSGNYEILRAIAIRVKYYDYIYNIAKLIPEFCAKMDNGLFYILTASNSMINTKQGISKIRKLSYIYMHKDSYNWNLAPGDLEKLVSKENYENLFALLKLIASRSTQAKLENFMNLNIVKSLKTDIGIPDNYFIYFFNKYNKYHR